MLNLIGNLSLIFALITSLILLILSFKNFKLNSSFDFSIFATISSQFFLICVSFLTLLFAFVSSDFSNLAVYNNSHTTKPLFYKISGTWGNHEGSLLLWLLVLSLFILIFFFKSKQLLQKFRYLTIFFQQIIILGFLLFIIFTSNPFQLIIPTPIDGLGLNPILQDPALAIHPPVLYLGYVGSSLIFSSSLASLVCNNINAQWAKHIKQWIILSWIFLTLGILLGSIWAYYELGWGGFWFWDPVENVSLMPWLCLTALFHTTIVLEKRNILKSWTLILSIGTFAFSMSGTFLVRSGILNSVHTFANDPERGLFILSFLFILIFISLVLFFLYSQDKSVTEKNFFIISKETSILINNWFMMYFLSVIVIGTVYPIFLEVLVDEKISIGPPFFNKLLIPFLIPFLIFMAIGPNLNWIKGINKKINYKNLLLFIICLITSYYLSSVSSSKFSLISFLFASSLYLFFITSRDIIKKKYNFSQTFSHFGFSILVLSILLNSIFSKEFSANMKLGDQLDFGNERIKLINIQTLKKKNYNTIITNFEILDHEKNITVFKPEIRIYNQPNILTSEADIISSIFRDKFMVVNLIKGKETFNVRYQSKPFMLWIWFSTILISIGGIISLVKRH